MRGGELPVRGLFVPGASEAVPLPAEGQGSAFGMALALSLVLHAGLAGGLWATRGLGWFDASSSTAGRAASAMGVSSERALIVALQPEAPAPAAPPRSSEPEPPPVAPPPEASRQPPPPATVPERPPAVAPPPADRPRVNADRGPMVIDVTALGKDTDRPATNAFLESLREGVQTGPKFTSDQAALTRNAGGQRVAEAPSSASAASSTKGLPGEPGLPGAERQPPEPPRAEPLTEPAPRTEPQPDGAMQPLPASPPATRPEPPAPPLAPPARSLPPVPEPPQVSPPARETGSLPEAVTRPSRGVGAPEEVELPVAQPRPERPERPDRPETAAQPPAPAAPSPERGQPASRPLSGLFTLPRLNDLPRRPASPTAPVSPSAPAGASPSSDGPTGAGQGGANGQRAGGARRAGEAGDQSDRDSPIAAVVGRPELRAGRVVVGQGLEVRTSRINLDTLERFQVAGQSALVDIYFRKDGTVRDVDFVQSSGPLDEPIANAVFRWRASGRDLGRLPPPSVDPQAAVRVRIRITLD